MPLKTHIVEQLGETALVLPGLVAAGLRANDRAKSCMSVLLACRDRALSPDQPPGRTWPPSARRAARTIRRSTRMIAGSSAGPDGTFHRPAARRISWNGSSAASRRCARRYRVVDGRRQPLPGGVVRAAAARACAIGCPRSRATPCLRTVSTLLTRADRQRRR